MSTEESTSAAVSSAPSDKETTCELFVGDLSYFCEERHIQELFSSSGEVVSSRIRRSDQGGHSLMHGFVRMGSNQQAKLVVQKYNGTLFMGRFLRVQLCTSQSDAPTRSTNSSARGIQIHTSFITHRNITDLVNEQYLRNLFSKYGHVVDAVICRHKLHQNPSKQAGYGFVTLSNQAEADAAMAVLEHYVVDDIQFDSVFSHRDSPFAAAQAASRALKPFHTNPANQRRQQLKLPTTQTVQMVTANTRPAAHSVPRPAHNDQSLSSPRSLELSQPTAVVLSYGHQSPLGASSVSYSSSSSSAPQSPQIYNMSDVPPNAPAAYSPPTWFLPPSSYNHMMSMPANDGFHFVGPPYMPQVMRSFNPNAGMPMLNGGTVRFVAPHSMQQMLQQQPPNPIQYQQMSHQPQSISLAQQGQNGTFAVSFHPTY